MLTRTQVARRLGRSLATVRRLEGNALHPEKDANGVNLFDPDEVDDVAERLRAGSTIADLGPTEGSDPWQHTSTREQELLAEIDQLRSELHRAGARARRAESDLDRFRTRTMGGVAELGRELVQVDPALGSFVLAAMEDLFD